MSGTAHVIAIPMWRVLQYVTLAVEQRAEMLTGEIVMTCAARHTATVRRTTRRSGKTQRENSAKTRYQTTQGTRPQRARSPDRVLAYIIVYTTLFQDVPPKRSQLLHCHIMGRDAARDCPEWAAQAIFAAIVWGDIAILILATPSRP